MGVSATTSLQAQPNWIGVSLAAARRGDHAAFTDLVTPHAPRLRRVAQRFTRSVEDTEDVCQESLLKAFTKLDQFAAPNMDADEFRAWLTKITANCAIDFLRRKKADKFIPLDEHEGIASESRNNTNRWNETPETACTRQEQMRLIANAMAKLPVELQAVCLLRNVMELSTKETAARLGISTGAVRLRLFRAHRQLRKMLVRQTHKLAKHAR
jgi:RNA polymerase sigma-70 factor (ECF subfamily)